MNFLDILLSGKLIINNNSDLYDTHCQLDSRVLGVGSCLVGDSEVT